MPTWNDINSVIQYVPLGTFWSGDWTAPEDGIQASTTGRDRLELLSKSTYSTSQVAQNQTLYALAVAVLTDAGMTAGDYFIDTDLQNYTVPYAYFESMSHRSALRLIAEAALGQVFCDRNGVLRIEGKDYLSGNTSSILTVTRDDYFSKDNPPKSDQVANYIEVETQPLRPDTAAEVYRSNNPIAVAAGQIYSLTAYYNNKPCINASASLVGATNTTITAATYYAWGASLTLTNSGGTAENVTPVINATPLKILNKEKAIAQDATSILLNGNLKYSFPANQLVQTLALAQTIADALLSSYKDPRRDLSMDWRGNPALLLGERVTVNDRNGSEDFFVTKQEFDYNGSLRVKMEGKKA